MKNDGGNHLFTLFRAAKGVKMSVKFKKKAIQNGEVM